MKTSEVKHISERILSSKKYKNLYPGTIERITGETAQKYPEKDVEQKARQKLHQIWGAYIGTSKYRRATRDTEAQLDENIPVKQVMRRLLGLHSSTRERLPYLDDFYNKIFAITGKPKTVIDHGCGLNPLTYPWMGDIEYTGYDIDLASIEFVNTVAELAGFGKTVEVKPGDLLLDTFPEADVVLFLKVLTPLEQQEKGSSRRILSDISARHIVISYPTRSIGGREKGMREFYKTSFYDIIKGSKWSVHELEFENELVFVIEK